MSKVIPLPGLDKNMNQLRSLSIQLKDLIENLTPAEKETLDALGFDKDWRRRFRGNAFRIVGILHVAARLREGVTHS